MAKNIGPEFIKYSLFIFNLICAVGGLGLVVASCYALKATGDLTKALGSFNDTEFFAVSVIILGSFIFIVSFCGCCGAIRESECFLNLYSLALILIAIIQVVIALYSCFYNEEIQKRVEECWEKLWLGGDKVEINSKAIKEIQKYVGCCGNEGIKDYGVNPNCEDSQYYSKGCREGIKTYVQESSAIIAYISLAMAIVEIVGVVFGCILSAHIRTNRAGYE